MMAKLKTPKPRITKPKVAMGLNCLKDFSHQVVLLLQKFARLGAVLVLSLTASAGYAA